MYILLTTFPSFHHYRNSGSPALAEAAPTTKGNPVATETTNLEVPGKAPTAELPKGADPSKETQPTPVQGQRFLQ